MKSQLVCSLAERRRRMENGADVVVGVNRFTETDPSPLHAEGAGAILTIDPGTEEEVVKALQQWRAGRDQAAVDEALRELVEAAKTDTNLVQASIACAEAGVTTGEWAGALRQVFGEYRAPTGVPAASAVREAGTAIGKVGRGCARSAPSSASGCESWSASRASTGTPTAPSGWRCGPATAVSRWSNQGIRLTPAQIVAAGAGDVPVVVGGIIPPEDARELRERGVAAVFTPKDFALTEIMNHIIDLVRAPLP